MLNLYIKSVIFYWIILLATTKLAKYNIESQNIDLKKYIKSKGKSKITIPLIALVPIYRFLLFLTALFFTLVTEDMLNKIFKEEVEEDE